MTLIGWLQIGLLFLIVAALVKPLGLFMASVFTGERTVLSPVLGPVERGFYAAAGVDPEGEQGWLSYTLSMLTFSMTGFMALWQIVEPTVRQALIDVPIAQRVLLAKSSADIHGEITKLIFEAVDRKYRLVALPAIPAGNRGGWWELAFEQQYGKPKSSDTLLA